MTGDHNTNHDVYMTRHSAGADRDVSGWTSLPGRKRDDTEISPGGRMASDELAARLERTSIAHIVSSPFYRCIQTVAPIATTKNIPIKVEPGICEDKTLAKNTKTVKPPNDLKESPRLCENSWRVQFCFVVAERPVWALHRPLVPVGMLGIPVSVTFGMSQQIVVGVRIRHNQRNGK
eukprot:scaffold1640_cov161-Amphora_coffeaeformis.AAC.50